MIWHTAISPAQNSQYSFVFVQSFSICFPFCLFLIRAFLIVKDEQAFVRILPRRYLLKITAFSDGWDCSTFDFFKKYYMVHCATSDISSKVDSSTVFLLCFWMFSLIRSIKLSLLYRTFHLKSSTLRYFIKKVRFLGLSIYNLAKMRSLIVIVSDRTGVQGECPKTYLSEQGSDKIAS